GGERQGMAVLQRAKLARAAPRATSRNQSDGRYHDGWPAWPRKEGHRQAVTRLRPVQNRSRLRSAVKPRALLFGRILNRLLCLRLRLGRRFDGRFGRTRRTALRLAPARRVFDRPGRWRVCPAGNNAFDSVAPGTSREQRCKNENCSDAHHDTAPRTGCAANADKLGQPGTFLTASGPYRLLWNYARCTLCWFRRRHIFV